MDGENKGKLPIKMDDLGGKPAIFGNIHMTGLCKSPIQQRTRLNLSPLRCCDEILGEKGGVTLDITPLGKNGATPIAPNPWDPYH